MSGITIQGSEILIHAGALGRRIAVDAGGVRTTGLSVGEHVLATEPSGPHFRVQQAQPDRRPPGLAPGAAQPIRQTTSIEGGTDALEVRVASAAVETTAWVAPRLHASSNGWSMVRVRRLPSRSGAHRVGVRLRGTPGAAETGLAFDLIFECYDGHDAIRSWVELANHGPHWLLIDRLVIDDIAVADEYAHPLPLTPEELGAGACVVAFTDPERRRGVLVASEVPSALRRIGCRGASGYSEEHFEWVLGPGEVFTSEATGLVAVAGDEVVVPGGRATVLDRCVEGPFKEYLSDVLELPCTRNPAAAPSWCTWSNFGPRIDDAILREVAGLAADCGFRLLLVDAGWQASPSRDAWDCGGGESDGAKFPDFAATAAAIRATGLELGLWMSTYRHPDSRDLAAIPDGSSEPRLERGNGIGMSYASRWRDWYAEDLVELADRYGASYFKQDLTNIRFGDLREGHEGRTRKDSVVRALRGFLAALAEVSRRAPEVHSCITHEIYWGTPGTPCDLAALRVAHSYHIPPNTYRGIGHWKKRVAEAGDHDPSAMRAQQLECCFLARRRFYAHRALPLQAVEFYAAGTVDIGGSLDADIQDRQVCSWLLGAPLLYAGDLASLSPAHRAHYRKRFDLLARLEEEYGIYSHFQFSGVPEPTDTDWHWWGKLRGDGCGVVVVLRGDGGSDRRRIHIPWLPAEGSWRCTALFTGNDLGVRSAAELREGIQLELPVYGQEIIRLARG